MLNNDDQGKWRSSIHDLKTTMRHLKVGEDKCVGFKNGSNSHDESEKR